MADIDISVGELPEAEYFDGESILLVENQGIAERVSGAQIKGFLRSGNGGGGGEGGSSGTSVQADLGQNDPNQPDYVKGRTHWYDGDGFHPLNGRFLPDSVPWVENYATDIFSCEVLLDGNGEAKLDVRPEIFEGGNYVVSWNGAEFNCEARAFEENGAYIGMAIGPGDPFTIILVTEEMVETVGSSFLVRGSLDYARTVVDLRISNRGIYYQKLQKELLPDDVPFVYATEQSLTEDQKAQARENIGVENVLESVGGDTLTWDGNTEGLASGTMVNPVYKVSDVVLTKEQLVSGTTITVSLLDGSEERTYLLENNADIMVAENDGALIIAQSDFSAVFLASMSDETAAAGGLPGMGGTIFGLFQNGGTYIKSITIPGYTGFAKKQIKEEYIPESVPQVQTAAVGQTVVVSEVDAEGKPTKWEAAEFPAGGGGEEWELIVDYTVPETVNGLTIDKDLNGNPFELKRWRVITAYFPVEGEKTVHATQIGFTSVSLWGHCLYAARPAPTASETASISIAVCGVLGDIQFLEHFSGSQNNTNAAFNIIVQHPPTTQGRRMNEQGEFVSAGTTGNATCLKLCGYQTGCVHAGSIVKMWGVRA